ncbi:MAG: glycoside hydrolase family 99-like domain-containing protein [Rickettsiales bacterium]|nr:glycoside hydrolase family 99-like domain-containing protein [Rickettsiales bacterium]
MRFFHIISRVRRTQLKNINKARYITARQKITRHDKAEFMDWCMNGVRSKKNFVPLSDRYYEHKSGDPKIIAYYLPQFYEFEQNNKWFGRGFTEWTNVTKQTPQYTGHIHPRLPIDVGFYNLDTTAIMKRQIDLARQYGVYGFCYYYYWFHGKRIMEKPLFNMLADKSIDMPFMLFYANENWSNTWGEECENKDCYDADIVDGDAEKFVDDILPFLTDSRYIKNEAGQPMLIIYKHKQPRIKEFITDIKRLISEKIGVAPYIILFNNDWGGSNRKTFSPGKFNADGAGEFNFHMQTKAKNIKPENWPKIMNKNAKYKMFFDTHKFISDRKYMYDTDYVLYRGCMQGFDNSCRKAFTTGAWVGEITPDDYYKWLRDIVDWTRKYGAPEKIVFVSAWNEWAETMYLEPDNYYGYAYLDKTRRAIEETR